MTLKSFGTAMTLGVTALVTLSACGPSEPVGTQVLAIPGGVVGQQPATISVGGTQAAVAPSTRQTIMVAPASQQIAAFSAPNARVNLAGTPVATPGLTNAAQAATTITSVDSSVISPSDRKLSGAQITALISGKTLLSQRATDPNDRQVGSFLPSGQMAVSTGGQDVTGSWTIEGDTVCYLLSGSKFCSTMHQTSRVYNGQPVYYFRRANGNVGEPTVIVYSIQ